MSKYIDSEKLIAEIERRVEEYNIQSLRGAELSDLLSFITSLQQGQPEVDLAEEITRFFSKNPIPHEHITDWPLLKNTAIHFYELGLNARKED